MPIPYPGRGKRVKNVVYTRANGDLGAVCE